MQLLHTMDSFYFRGHGSFGIGDQIGAPSLFPPRPGTVYGAYRTAWIERNGTIEDFLNGDYAEAIGTPEQSGALQLRGLFLKKGEDIFLPLPYDHQVVDGKAYPLELRKGLGYESDGAVYRLYGPIDQKSESADGKWIRLRDVEELLTHHRPVEVFSRSYFVHEEPKVGVALDRVSGRVEESMLYQINRLRLKRDVSLLVDSTLNETLPTVKLGQGSTRWLVAEDDTHTIPIRIGSTESDTLRVTWLTPAVITEPLVMEGRFRYFDAPWIQTAMARTGLDGGWDMVKQRPKIRKTLIPAGTSLLVDARRQSLTDLPSQLTDEGKEQGYGRVMYSSGPSLKEEMK